MISVILAKALAVENGCFASSLHKGGFILVFYRDAAKIGQVRIHFRAGMELVDRETVCNILGVK